MLTTRQREVLHLMAQGKTNKEIASALKIISRTVHFHKAIIRRKLSQDRFNMNELKEIVGETDIDILKKRVKRYI